MLPSWSRHPSPPLQVLYYLYSEFSIYHICFCLFSTPHPLPHPWPHNSKIHGNGGFVLFTVASPTSIIVVGTADWLYSGSRDKLSFKHHSQNTHYTDAATWNEINKHHIFPFFSFPFLECKLVLPFNFFFVHFNSTLLRRYLSKCQKYQQGMWNR